MKAQAYIILKQADLCEDAKKLKAFFDRGRTQKRILGGLIIGGGFSLFMPTPIFKVPAFKSWFNLENHIYYAVVGVAVTLLTTGIGYYSATRLSQQEYNNNLAYRTM